MVKNPPSNAGDSGLIPGRGIKIPHASGQLSTPQLESRNKDLMQPKKERKIKEKKDNRSVISRVNLQD